MCGRARCTLRPDDFPGACYLNNARPVRHLNMDRYRPSYNVAPGFNVPVVRPDDEGDSNGVVLHCMKWGLVPSFTKKTEKIDHFKMFNARSESIREKASFRRLLPKNRCLVSVEGQLALRTAPLYERLGFHLNWKIIFYEWKKDGSRKQPYYIHFSDGHPLVFAALYDSWKNSEGEILYTFTIITTSSSSSLEWLHDRMPVILGDKESTDRWLNDSSLTNLDQILKPYEENDLAWYPVTSVVGKLSFDGPECIKEIQVKTENTRSISQFFSKKDVHAPHEPKVEKPRKVYDSVEASELESVKEEPESLQTLETTGIRMKDESVENSQQQSTKEELESQDDDDHHQSMSPKGGPSVIDKRDYAEFSSQSFAEETGNKNISRVRKRNKGVPDKQPTLFSYFGRS